MAPMIHEWGVISFVEQRSLLLSAKTQSLSSAGMTLILVGGVLLVAIGALLLNERRARQQAQKSTLAGAAPELAQRLPAGKIVYQDTDGSGTPLFAKNYPLSGKPDYVVLSPEGVPIPVELKLGADAQEPQRSHIMQLAAYFVILEDLYERSPQYGVLRYAKREFTIQYTQTLKRKVLRRLAEMEQCDERRPPMLTGQLLSKCRVCPFQPICPIGQRHV
jgi:CRISPR-associated exonuclease Cas4